MSRVRGRFKSTRSISISSSSSTSQASEDSAPESDSDIRPRQRGYCAPNDMSERQTRKINSGSFGMFNGSPTLSSPSRTPRSRRKRSAETPTAVNKKTKKASVVLDDGGNDIAEMGAQLQRRSGDPVRGMDDDSLFIPETDTRQKSATVFETATEFDPFADADGDTDSDLFEDLPFERKTRAQSYMRALEATRTGDTVVNIAQESVKKLEAQQAHLTQQLMDLEPTAAERMEKIKLAKEEAIRRVIEDAERDTTNVLKWMEETRVDYSRLEKICVSDKEVAKGKVLDVVASLEAATDRKRELKVEGGFQLAWDVRDVEEKKRRKLAR